MNEKLKQTMARIFDVPAERIDEAASLETLDEWTSLTHLRLVTEIESEFGVKFSMQDAVGMTSFAKLSEFLDGSA